MTLSAAQVFSELRATLAAAGSAQAGRKARVLMTGIAGIDAAALIRAPDAEMGADTVARLHEAARQTGAGMSVHRAAGWREFHGVTLRFGDDCLEPRPDTEALVDLVLPWLLARESRSHRPAVLDLGTGSGAVALAILAQTKEATALGTDIADRALATARDNARANGLARRFDTLRSDWFKAVEGRFDLIVSNPPYIARDTIASLEPAVRDHDPIAALDGGADGLDAYRAIAANAHGALAADGRIAVEIGLGQRSDVEKLFGANGFAAISMAHDMEGRKRALMFAPQKGLGNDGEWV